MDITLPRGRRARQIFYWVVIPTSLAILLTRALLLPRVFGIPAPTLDTVIDSVLGEVFVGLVAGTLLASFLLFLLPNPKRNAVMEIVPAYERSAVLDLARARTDTWWFSGATGRYTRAVTLPHIARSARLDNVSKSVLIQILDPRDQKLCQAYASYRSGVRTGRGDASWTVTRVQRELYATILSAYAWTREEPLLDVTVALKTTLSLFRFDLSSTLLIITKEDPLEPALRCDQGTFFYTAFREDLKMSLSQARELPKTPSAPPRSALTPATARAFLAQIGLESRSLTHTDLEAIVALVENPEDPYA